MEQAGVSRGWEGMRFPALLAASTLSLLAACGTIEPPQSTDVSVAPTVAANRSAAMPAPASAPPAASEAPGLQPLVAEDVARAGLEDAPCRFTLPQGELAMVASQNEAAVKIGGSVTTFQVPVGDFRSIEMGPTLSNDSLIVTVGAPGAAESGTTLDAGGGAADLQIEAAGGTPRSYRGEWRCQAAGGQPEPAGAPSEPVTE